MPITPRLSHKLHQALGEEAGAEFMAWMHHVDARVADVVTRGDLAEMRESMRADLAELRQEVQVGFAKMHEEMARLETRFERRFGGGSCRRDRDARGRAALAREHCHDKAPAVAEAFSRDGGI